MLYTACRVKEWCPAWRLRAAQCRRRSPEKEKSHKKQNSPQPHRITGNRYYEQDVYYLGIAQPGLCIFGGSYGR